jgi:hypothetical protein
MQLRGDTERALRSVLLPNKDGLLLAELEREFRSLVGRDLPYEALGYRSPLMMLQNMQDVVRMEKVPGSVHILVHARPDKSTQHIANMVRTQRDNPEGYSKLTRQIVSRSRGQSKSLDFGRRSLTGGSERLEKMDPKPLVNNSCKPVKKVENFKAFLVSAAEDESPKCFTHLKPASYPKINNFTQPSKVDSLTDVDSVELTVKATLAAGIPKELFLGGVSLETTRGRGEVVIRLTGARNEVRRVYINVQSWVASKERNSY